MKSNSEVEVTVQHVHGLARTLKDMLEDKIQETIPAKHPILAWLIEHAATLITLFAKGADGMTPYRRLKGKPWKIPIPPVGEQVHYRVATKHKLEVRWSDGIFLGIRRTTSEKLVGTEQRIFVVQSIRRKPDGEQWCRAQVMALKGTPWTTNPGVEDPGELPMPVTLVPEQPQIERSAADSYNREVQNRRLYITRKDLEDPRIGYTPGCPACDETKAGRRTAGIQHTKACRQRIEDFFINSGDPTHQERVNRWIDARDKLETSVSEKRSKRKLEGGGFNADGRRSGGRIRFGPCCPSSNSDSR